MNVAQITSFLAVAHHESFTRAAAAVHVSQPALSLQMKALEEELGCRLFVRLPRKVQLTPEGRAFLPEAASVAAAMTRARAVVLDGGKTTAGTLRVGTVLSLSLGVLPPSLTEMRRRHPAVSVELIEYSHRNLLEQGLIDGECDIAVGPRPSEWHGTLVSMGWEEFVVVLPDDDPAVSSRDRVDLRDLASRDWVLFTGGLGLTPLVNAACARAGFVPRGRIRTAQVAVAARLAAAGAGVAMVPGNVLGQGHPGRALRLVDPVVRELATFSRLDPGPLVVTYAEIVRATAHQINLLRGPAA